MKDNMKLKLWDKALKIDGLDPMEYRKDVCGALMIFSKYGMLEDEFGWIEDYIYPISRGGDDRLDNLRPMQAKNAISKGDDFPVYFRAVKSVNNRNVPMRGQCRVSLSLIEKIREFYGYQG